MTTRDPASLAKTQRRIIWTIGVIFLAWTAINLWGFFAWAEKAGTNLSLDILGHGLLWLLGLAGVAWSGQRILRYLQEQARIADELRQSEARYRQLVELSPAGIAIHQDGKIVFVNPAILALLGAGTSEQLLGQDMLQFVHPDSRALVRERIARMAVTGQPEPAVVEKLLRPDGSIVDVQLAAAPLLYGGKAAFQVLIYDQTRQKHLERALQFIEKGVSTRMGQAFFQSAVVQLAGALAADVVFIGEYLPETERVRTLAVCADGSPAPNFDYALAGAPCANVINHELCCYPSGVADLFPLDDGLRTLKAEGYLGMPLWTAERAPSGVLVALYRRPIDDLEFARSVVQIFASRLEVEVERDRILRDLRESQARLTAIFENVPFDLWLSDVNDVTVLQNPVSRRLWGDTLNKSIDEMEAPAALKAIWRANNQRVLAGETVRSFQTVERNGQLYHLESFQAPVHSGEKIIGYVGANIDITRQKLSELKIEQSLRQLTLLREIDQTILSGQELRVVTERLCRQAAQLLQVDGVEILQYDAATLRLEILARHGLQVYSTFGSFPVQQDIAADAILKTEIIHRRDFPVYLKQFPACQELAKENYASYAALPLIAKGSPRGVLEIFQRADLAPDPEWWQLAQTVASQAALALDNFSLFHSLQHTNAELSLTYDLTLEGWSKALELRDYETEGHTQRVTNLTVRLAEFMNVPRIQIVHLRRGALLHDIGKIGIPDAILNKKGPLTEEEWQLVRKHPGFAYDLLFPIPFLRPALDIPHYHHERWNGSGYPSRLRGQDIPLAARIFAVADVWDALTSERPYHQAASASQTFEYLRQNSAVLFDPDVVRAFFLLMKQPWGE